VDLPWLQETADLLAAARAAGLDLAVLRLLSHEHDETADVLHCVYLALEFTTQSHLNHAQEAPAKSAVLGPVPIGLHLDDHPLRLAYARPRGIVGNLAWADSQLAALGRRRAAPAQQQRTWNLSCVHRLLLDDGSEAWLKAVPPFFAQEGAVIDFLLRFESAGGNAVTLHLPPLLAFDASDREGAGGRLLMAHCGGPLMWGTGIAAWRPIIAGHIERQLRLSNEGSALLALGLPDWRGPALLAALQHLCARPDVQSALTAAVRAGLAELIMTLPARLTRLQACGLPDTLVHGDLHQGNVIATEAGPVLLDWGDAGVGMPLLDLPALCLGFEPDVRPQVRDAVRELWQQALPDADVAGAMAIIPPIVELRQALIYQHFLDNVEPAEQHYHRDDVPARLTAAVLAAAGAQ
jgi:hypothetical protein